MDRLRAKTWRFDFKLEIGPFLCSDDVRISALSILKESHEKIPIRGLEQSSVSYNVPEYGVAEISGYLHASADIWESTTDIWLRDNRISCLKWRAVLPGRNGNWKKDGIIKEIF